MQDELDAHFTKIHGKDANCSDCNTDITKHNARLTHDKYGRFLCPDCSWNAYAHRQHA